MILRFLRHRQRIQVALTSLGFDTRGADGAFGPRSREMIAAWQRARKRPVTGYLTAADSLALRETKPAAGPGALPAAQPLEHRPPRRIRQSRQCISVSHDLLLP